MEVANKINVPLLIRHHRVVEEAYRNKFGEEGYVAFMVAGREGSGKTAYALWLGYLVYRDWDVVLKHLYFNPLDAIVAFEKALDRGERLKYVILDDAGLWISKYRTYDRPVKAFIEFYNVIRTLSAAVMMTSPSDEIQRMLREKAWIRMIAEHLTWRVAEKYGVPIHLYGIEPDKQPLSLARIYELNLSPTLERYVSKRNAEIYPRHYPVKPQYDVLRRTAVKSKIKEIKYFFGEQALLTDEKFLLKVTAYTLAEIKHYTQTQISKILGRPQQTVSRWIRQVRDWIGSFSH